MAPSSRRRTRLVEDPDDDDVSRQSRPASTAPYDGKRARRSSTHDSEDSATVGRVDGNTMTTLRKDHRPDSEANGIPRAKPKHQPGAIVRVKLTNFVTYTSAEFFPGPNLNMVIGPNGTGKSTLVCAICLGLGWGTQYLGRAKDAAEFVKHGCREATIEIELQRALKGTNASSVNPVITRTIKREGNKSLYTLHGHPAAGKAVVDLARSFDIQIDNLCQFLPQDKVVEFAQMTPIEILQSTQRAAAPPTMLQMHNNLKTLREAHKDRNNNRKNDREALMNLENRQEMQKTEVERLRERAVVQKRLTWLQRCKPIPQYAEMRTKLKDAKVKQKAVSTELKQLEKESTPTLKQVEAKRLYVKQVKDYKTLREKDTRNAERDCERLNKTIDNQETVMKDCGHIHDSEKKSMQPIREEMNRTKNLIAQLKKQKQQEPEPFDGRAMNQKIQEGVNRMREIQSRKDELTSQAGTLRPQYKVRVERYKQLKESIQQLETEVGRQEDKLKEKSGDTYRAWQWIKDHRDMFHKPVFGPPMVECTLRDPSVAGSVESVMQRTDTLIITTQCREDFRILQEELIRKQRLHDISLRVCPFDSLDHFTVPLSPEQMKQFGFKGWAVDFIDGPLTVVAMLCQEKFLHQCAITEGDVTQDQHDQLSTITSLKSYISRTTAYQFVRRAEYGSAGVHARQTAVKKPMVWGDQPTDSGRQQQMQNEMREIRSDTAEIQSQIQALGKENEELEKENKELDGQVTRTREEKDEKQKALTEHNALDTKVSGAENKLANLERTLAATGVRLEENQRKQDEAMFRKADIVVEYCEAVHKLQEKTKAQIEIEVAYIEAHNDYEVLADRNQNLLRMLEAKRQEEKETLEVITSHNKRARELAEDVKQLRNEGLELEQAENDRGLTDMLSDLAATDGLKESDLDDLIKVEEAKLELTEGGDTNTIKEFEARAKKMEQLRSKLTESNTKQQEVMKAIHEVREQWEQPLDALVAKISSAFGDSFARIGCAGQVMVHKASSDDPADCIEELGGSDNGLDFANWAIHISVKFRENEPLSLLDSHRQSGGERAVSTIFYLMALQSLSRAPFRVVDEINQGMDPRNERMVHGRMVDIAAADENGNGQGSQYFLITPKLLSGLKYKTGMTVLCIVSGENMPNAAATKVKDDSGMWVTRPGKTINFAEFARTARRLQLNRSAAHGINGGIDPGMSFDSRGTMGTLGRSQASVGA